MRQYIYFLFFITTIFFGCSVQESDIPDALIGNYYDNDGKDFWSYSLQKDFIIYDSKFWDVKKVKTKKGITKVIIENENSKRRLQISPISSSDFEFEDNKNSKIYSSIANSDVRKAKNIPFSMRPGKVKIYGFIKNSAKYIESTPRIEFTYNDYITMDSYSVYAPIDSSGRFQLEMELLSPQDIWYKLDKGLHSVFVAPSDTLMIFFDPEHPENTDFQGTRSDVNYDLLNTKEHRYRIASAKENHNQLSKHFDEYKEYRDSVCEREKRFLNKYAENEYCSELFEIWYKTYSYVSYYSDLLTYSWKNYHIKNAESGMNTYELFRDKYLKEMETNDTIASITAKYFFYVSAIGNKIPHRKSLFNWIMNELDNNYPGLTFDEKRMKYDEILLSKKIEKIKEIKTGRLRDILLTNLVSGEILKRNIDNIDKTLDDVDDLIQYKPYLTHLSNHVASFKRKEAEFDKNPIAFKLSNSSGELLLKKIIQDNKDKVIILDFWFTACGACRKDFEKMSVFKKDLSVEADVEFVYLCYDSDETDWKYVTKEYNLQGQNYLLTQEQIIYFKDLFSISSAPRYILINKAGKIVNSNFIPPMYINQFILELKRAI